jgi:hypothetical protein
MAWNCQADAPAHGKERQFQYKSRQSAGLSETSSNVRRPGKPRRLAARYSADDAILVCENVRQIEAIADVLSLLLARILTVFTRK